ncbi:MAG: hypothetical protein AAF732_05525 [Pseudomonadota bacterium]
MGTWRAYSWRICLGLVVAVGVTVAAMLAWRTYQDIRWHASLHDPMVKVLELSRHTRQAGRSFQECETCPEMVVVPAGRVLMGASWPDDLSARPQWRAVVADAFAVSKHDITFVE